MEILIIVLILIILAQLVFGKKKISSMPKEDKPEKIESLPIAGAYQKKWLFSYNEKDAFKPLNEFCNQNGFTLMAKVRLLDVVEPVKGNPKYKTYFWKIQAKHIDFVICDQKLVARCIVELDDSSHDKEDRKVRDAFVDEVLQSVGYEILHTRTVDEAFLEKLKAALKLEVSLK